MFLAHHKTGAPDEVGSLFERCLTQIHSARQVSEHLFVIRPARKRVNISRRRRLGTTAVTCVTISAFSTATAGVAGFLALKGGLREPIFRRVGANIDIQLAQEVIKGVVCGRFGSKCVRTLPARPPVFRFRWSVVRGRRWLVEPVAHGRRMTAIRILRSRATTSPRLAQQSAGGPGSGAGSSGARHGHHCTGVGVVHSGFACRGLYLADRFTYLFLLLPLSLAWNAASGPAFRTGPAARRRGDLFNRQTYCPVTHGRHDMSPLRYVPIG